MMIAWVLILVLHDWNAKTTTTVEFPTENGCIEAGKKAVAEFKAFAGGVDFICVEKK
jgi:hypothetical protein